MEVAMKRLYFLAPSLESTTAIVDELHSLGVKDRDIHVVGNNHTGMAQNHVHEASLLQTSDVIPALERGAAIGVTSGLLAGLVAISFPPAGLVLGGGAVLGMSLFGAGFGAWVSSMIGVSVPNETIVQYEEAIQKGQFLLIIDIPKVDEFRIADLILKHHPEASIDEVDLNLRKVS
jgi:hypothetical protein